MARALVPLDVIYPIVSDVVVDCVDAMFMGAWSLVLYGSPPVSSLSLRCCSAVFKP